jgi:hypothetical protein
MMQARFFCMLAAGAVLAGGQRGDAAAYDPIQFRDQAVRFEKRLAQEARERISDLSALEKKWKQWSDAEQKDPERGKPDVRAKYAYYRSVLSLGALARLDPLYAPAADQLEERLARLDKEAADLVGRMSNGIYRVVEMSGLYAASRGVPNDDIENIFARMKYEDRAASTVQRQMRNGLYRAIEMFLLLARHRNVPDEKTDAIILQWREEDTKAKTVFTQLDIGALRLADMLDAALFPMPAPAPPVPKPKVKTSKKGGSP